MVFDDLPVDERNFILLVAGCEDWEESQKQMSYCKRFLKGSAVMDVYWKKNRRKFYTLVLKYPIGHISLKELRKPEKEYQ